MFFWGPLTPEPDTESSCESSFVKAAAGIQRNDMGLSDKMCDCLMRTAVEENEA